MRHWLKIIWRHTKPCLLLKVSWCGRYPLICHPLCLWELDPYSRTWQNDPSPWDEMLSENLEHFLQKTSDKRGGSQQDPWCNRSAWWSPDHDEAESRMVWLHPNILWHDKDNSAEERERSTRERMAEEEMGRHHLICEWVLVIPSWLRKTWKGKGIIATW